MGHCNASLSGRLALPAGLIAALAVSCTLDDPAEVDEADESAASSSAAIDESERRTRHREPKLTPQASGTVNRLAGGEPGRTRTWYGRAAWAARTPSPPTAGDTGSRGVVPGAEALQFRDVEGVSDQVAYLLAAGVGTDSRIYKTEDGGETWTLQFQNEDPNGFYDCFAFWTPTAGLTMADAIDGRFPVIRTCDGETWQDIGDNLPAGQAGEAAFAASGTCVATHGRQARPGSPPAAAARPACSPPPTAARPGLRTTTPIVQGTAELGRLQRRLPRRRARHPGRRRARCAGPSCRTTSRASGWRKDLGARHRLRRFRAPIFGLSYALGRDRHDHGHHPGCDHVTDTDGDELARGGWHRRQAVVATGPGGAAWSPDEGDTWSLLEGVADYWAVAFANRRTGWLVGTEGRILKIELPRSMTARRAALAGLLVAACGQPGRAPSAEQPWLTVTAELDARLSARAECSSLDGVQAGSGLVRLGRRLVVVQDAAAAVVLLAPETGAAERVVLSGRGKAQAKADKPDYEAAVRGAGGAIHVLGSGLAPTRRRIARLDPDGDGIARVAVVDGGPLYDAIAAALGSAPNIEGAVAHGDQVRLLHRGAGSPPPLPGGNAPGLPAGPPKGPARSATFDVPASALGGAAPGPAVATWFDLGRIGRVPLTFTDAVAAGDSDAVPGRGRGHAQRD